MKRFTEWFTRLRATEPVRVFLLPVVAAITGTLVAKGTIDGTTELIVLGVVATVVGVPLGEAIRSKVTPTGKVAVILDQASEQATGAIDAVESQAKASGIPISPDVQRYLDQARETARMFGGRHARP